jgi:hypothetical protein
MVGFVGKCKKHGWYDVDGYPCPGCEERDKAKASIKKLKAENAELKTWKQAVDDALIVHHIGTTDSLEPKDAINLLCQWNYDFGIYFGERKRRDKKQPLQQEGEK